MQIPGYEQKIVQYLLQQGLINARQIQECLSLQQRYQQQGQSVTLTDILVRRQYLPAEQLEKVKKLCQEMSTARLPAVPSGTAMAERHAQPSSEAKTETVFGRYKILKELGRGGMGVVYQAYDPNLQRHVALKIINQLMANDKDIKRFEREAQVMAKLKHPHIVQILDIGEEQGRCFFTMELVEGVNLKTFLQEHLPLPRLLKLVIKVAQAVYYANNEGVIHRDLKPSNILISADEEPKVLDFGLAKDTTAREQLSQSEDFLGTPQYMSPEQAEKKVVDARSDVYALGAVLYEMLTGRPPFVARTFSQLISKIVAEEPVPPSRMHPAVSRDLDSICLKALEKDKNKRYASAGALAEDLTRYLEGKPVLAKPITTLGRSWKWLRRNRVLSLVSGSALFLIVAAVLGLLYQLDQKRKIAEEGKRTAEHLVKMAYSEKERAVVKEAEAVLSQAEAELVLARTFIDRQNYFLAAEKVQVAQASLREAIAQLKSDQMFGGTDRSERQRLLRKGELLLSTTQNIYRYCIDPLSYPCSTDDFSEIKALLPKGFLVAPLTDPSRRFWVFDDLEEPRVIIWDSKQHKQIKSFPHHVSLRAAAFTKDDRLLCLGTERGKIILWDREADKTRAVQIEKGLDEKQNVRFVQFSPDGKWLVTATPHRMVIWEAATMNKVLDYAAERNWPVCAFSSNSQWLALGGKQGLDALSVVVFDMSQLAKTRPTSYLMLNAVHSLCFGPDDKMLVIGMVNDIKILSLKNTADKESVNLLGAHRGEILALAVDPDGNFFASLGKDQKLVLWSTYNYRKMFETPVTGDLSYYGVLHFDPTRKQLGVWNSSHFSLYDLDMRQEKSLHLLRSNDIRKEDKHLLKLRRNPIFRNQGKHLAWLSMSPDEKYLAYYIFPILYLWDLENGQSHYLHSHILSECDAMSFSQDSRFLAWNSFHQTDAWDITTKQKIFFYPAEDPRLIGEIIWQPHTNLVVKKSQPKVQLCRIEDNKLICQRELTAPTAKIEHVEFDPSGQIMAILYTELSSGSTIEVWRLNTPQEQLLSSYQIPHSMEVHKAIRFISENCLAFGTTNGDLCLYDWQKKEIVQRSSFYDPIEHLWYNPTDKMCMVFTSYGLYVYPDLQDVTYRQSLQRIYPLPLYAGYPIMAVDVSHDFRQIALMLQSGEIMLLPLRKP